MARHRETPDWKIIAVLEAPCTDLAKDLAAELEMRVQNVRDIRCGKLYGKLFPEYKRVPLLARNSGCCKCKFYIKRTARGKDGVGSPKCLLGLPDLHTDGIRAGCDCTWFQMLPELMTSEQSDVCDASADAA